MICKMLLNLVRFVMRKHVEGVADVLLYCLTAANVKRGQWGPATTILTTI